jgi:polar amino acid transport system substrate-binding protein
VIEMTTRARGSSPLIALLLLLAVVLVAAGCGGDNNDNKTTSTGKLDTISAGKLKVGSDIPYKPFEFGRAPNYQGFDVDVVTQVANKLGLDAQFVKTPFDTVFRNLAQGKFDMVASAATITPEREKEVDFSDPYFPADQSLMVKNGSDIKTIADLKGQVIGAQLGTTGADYAKKNTDASTVRTYDLIDDAFNALEAGQVKAVINDCPVSKYAEKAHKDLVVVRAIPTHELYGFAFANGSDALRTAFNDALAKVKKDGALASTQKKWLGTDPCKGLPGAS